MIPELIYKFGDAEPSFFYIRGLYGLEFTDGLDYVFAYTDQFYCAGNSAVTGDGTILVAHGSADGSTGFSPGAVMNVGVYNSQTAQFFSLGGTWKDYYTGDVVAAPTWGTLAFYVLEDTVVTGTIQMIPTPGISEETILFEAATSYDPVALGMIFYFNVKSQNVVGLNVSCTSGGTVIDGTGSQWYWNQSKWYRYACLINDGATSVNLLASGLSPFTGEAITLPHEVTIAQPEIPISDILYTNTYLSVRNINGMLYLQAETDTGIYVNFYHGGRAVNIYVAGGTRNSKNKGKKTLIGVAEGFTKINFAMYKGIGGLEWYEWSPRVQINQVLIQE